MYLASEFVPGAKLVFGCTSSPPLPVVCAARNEGRHGQDDACAGRLLNDAWPGLPGLVAGGADRWEMGDLTLHPLATARRPIRISLRARTGHSTRSEPWPRLRWGGGEYIPESISYNAPLATVRRFRGFAGFDTIRTAIVLLDCKFDFVTATTYSRLHAQSNVNQKRKGGHRNTPLHFVDRGNKLPELHHSKHSL